MEKESVFNGKIRLWNGLVFGKLESGDTVIIGNSVDDVRSLIGCTIKYKRITEASEPAKFSVVDIQL